MLRATKPVSLLLFVRFLNKHKKTGSKLSSLHSRFLDFHCVDCPPSSSCLCTCPKTEPIGITTLVHLRDVLIKPQKKEDVVAGGQVNKMFDSLSPLPYGQTALVSLNPDHDCSLTLIKSLQCQRKPCKGSCGLLVEPQASSYPFGSELNGLSQ